MDHKTFNFPFQPYDIQRQFMTQLYQCIDQGKIGIFESPTGTGKSLSLICGSLTWLREQQRSKFDAALNVEYDGDEPEWMIENVKQEKRREALRAREDLEARLAKAREKEEKMKRQYENGEPSTKKRKLMSNSSEDDEQYLLDDYESDNDHKSSTTGSGYLDTLGLSAETQKMLAKLGVGSVTKAEDDEPASIDGTVVIYCSRTHSQLSQFASELRRVKFPPVIDPEPGDERKLMEQLKHLTLGSRKNLCINPKVSKLSSATAITERCLEIQKPKTSSDHKCPYVPTKENQSLVNQFRDHAISRIRDIEDLGNLGRKMEICPYYASRAALPISEIITLPYPLILQKSARDALGISLKDHVVIIDEAHNLMDSICSINSCSVTLSQLKKGRGQLLLYLQKFRNRLKGKNRVYVTQIVRLLDSLVSVLETKMVKDSPPEGVLSNSELLSGKGADQINLFKLDLYLQESKIAWKVDGYVLAATEKAPTDQGKARSTTPVLMHIQTFMLALLNPSSSGRFVYTRDTSSGEVRLDYLLLDPTSHFREIIDEARSVVLAGGTMSPMSDYANHLFGYLPSEKLMTLSCQHIVPSTSLAVYTIAKGAGNQEMCFTHERRNAMGMIISAGLTLLEVVKVVPDGVVAFWPSYDYLAKCVGIWQKELVPGARQTIWQALSAVKPVFTERSSKATEISGANASSPQIPGTSFTEVLTAYSTAISSPPTPHRGALLLAVTSGSLSEGINFSDALGRCVLLFGLPFANRHVLPLSAKLAYVEAQAATAYRAQHNHLKGEAAKKDLDIKAIKEGQRAASEWYENATMRAVNQAVGRAIRHRNDYASIVLVDKRFEGERIRGKLAGWMRESVKTSHDVGGVVKELKGFFSRVEK